MVPLLERLTDEQIVAARLYVEPVDEREQDIRAAVEELYQPPA